MRSPQCLMNYLYCLLQVFLVCLKLYELMFSLKLNINGTNYKKYLRSFVSVGLGIVSGISAVGIFVYRFFSNERGAYNNIT